MPANEKKPQVEIPEEALIDEFVNEEDVDEEQPVLPQTRPESVSEADWADQQTDVPLDEDDEYS